MIPEEITDHRVAAAAAAADPSAPPVYSRQASLFLNKKSCL